MLRGGQVTLSLHILSTWVKLWLHTENELPRLPGIPLKFQWVGGRLVVQPITLSHPKLNSTESNPSWYPTHNHQEPVLVIFPRKAVWYLEAVNRYHPRLTPKPLARTVKMRAVPTLIYRLGDKAVEKDEVEEILFQLLMQTQLQRKQLMRKAMLWKKLVTKPEPNKLLLKS